MHFDYHYFCIYFNVLSRIVPICKNILLLQIEFNQLDLWLETIVDLYGVDFCSSKQMLFVINLSHTTFIFPWIVDR